MDSHEEVATVAYETTMSVEDTGAGSTSTDAVVLILVKPVPKVGFVDAATHVLAGESQLDSPLKVLEIRRKGTNVRR